MEYGALFHFFFFFSFEFFFFFERMSSNASFEEYEFCSWSRRVLHTYSPLSLIVKSSSSFSMNVIATTGEQ